MALPARTITVALDMSKAFDTINIHTLIRMLLQTNIPGTIIKGRKAYTRCINHTSSQRPFKTGVPQWDKQRETLMAPYKAVMRPALEYASSIWSLLASSTSINKLHVMQNAALRTATGCIQDTNIQHLHDETLILHIREHLQLHASQYKQKTQHPSLTLHKHKTYFNTPRLKTLSLTPVAT